MILGYEGTQISIEFDILQIEDHLMSSLVNAGAVNLFKSGFKTKCIPAAVNLTLHNGKIILG